MSTEPTIRRELHPGDLGAIVALHGTVYARDHGLDSTFEADLCATVAAAGHRGWPGQREGVWLVELDGRLAGSLALTDEGEDVAALRWVVLEQELRGRGLGRRLVGEAVRTARAHGYTTLFLQTFSELQAAAHLYREQGFELVSAQTGPRWGRAELTYQRYELELVSGARERGIATEASWR